MSENKPIEFTPEQKQMLKTANAHGFINQLVTDGVPDPAHPDPKDPLHIKSCTVEEATVFYQKAAKYQTVISSQAQEVKKTVRESLATK